MSKRANELQRMAVRVSDGPLRRYRKGLAATKFSARQCRQYFGARWQAPGIGH